LRDAFAGKQVKIEVYQDCQHGWCVNDGRVYNKVEAERAYAELVALYGKALV
jgi:carboxymethylenebutenolidase